MSREKIVLFKVFMSEDVLQPLNDVLMSGYIGQGQKVTEFEAALGNYFGNQHLVTVNAATSALHLSAHLHKRPSPDGSWPGLQPGDEVLTTALTCTATNFALLANGLKLKWVDVDPETCNMDLDDLERKISPTTKLITVVHWGGYPNDLDRLKEIQQRAQEKFGFSPPIIEDCAHAFGSRYKGELLGNHGNFASFSLQAIKHFTTGDGGILILPNEEMHRRAKLLRWYGIDREQPGKDDFRCEEDIPEWGYKFHMNDINATIGLYNFPHVEKCLQGFKDNAAYFDEALQGIDGVTLMRRDAWADSASWLYTIKVERRQDFMRYMEAKGVMVSRVHERNDKHSCVAESAAPLPNLDKLSEEMICIPNGWWVSPEDRDYIVECIAKGW
jgi:dTDP-4-amino-4,6-dideoxygalactose transaminase